MANTSLFMLSQVAKHKSKNDCWLVIDGQVLNVTRFPEEHPGGDVVILEVAGKDVTNKVQAAGQYHVGALEGYTSSSCSSPSFKETRKQMTAVVVKDDSTQKILAVNHPDCLHLNCNRDSRVSLLQSKCVLK